jgi:hypothetical protein
MDYLAGEAARRTDRTLSSNSLSGPKSVVLRSHS